MNVPVLFFGEAIEQQLGFATAADGTRIAYATSGNGPPIMHVLSINTDLINGQHSPIYDNDGLVAMSSRHNFFVRYDGRGMGLSDRDVDDFSYTVDITADQFGQEEVIVCTVSDWHENHPPKQTERLVYDTHLWAQWCAEIYSMVVSELTDT